jgi:hypothetical protein
MTLVDEKDTSLVDNATRLYLIEDVRNAKAVASTIEKLYGVRPSLIEVLRESSLYRQSSEGNS